MKKLLALLILILISISLSTSAIASTPFYTIDTLIKTSIEGLDRNADEAFLTQMSAKYLTSDGFDIVYYMNDSTIHSLDINTKYTESLFNVSDFKDLYDPFVGSYFQINGICWDDKNAQLLILGQYSNTLDVGNYLYSWKDNTLNIITDEFCNNASGCAYIIDVMPNGDYLVACPGSWEIFIVNCIDFRLGIKISDDCVYDIGIYQNSLKYFQQNEYSQITGFYNYDFKQTSSINISSSVIRTGISNRGYVQASTDKVIIFDDTDTILIDNFDVMDYTPVSFGTTINKWFLMEDNEVVFYDYNAKAFRIIKEGSYISE